MQHMKRACKFSLVDLRRNASCRQLPTQSSSTHRERCSAKRDEAFDHMQPIEWLRLDTWDARSRVRTRIRPKMQVDPQGVAKGLPPSAGWSRHFILIPRNVDKSHNWKSRCTEWARKNNSLLRRAPPLCSSCPLWITGAYAAPLDPWTPTSDIHLVWMLRTHTD